MPVRNGSAHVKEALTALLGQSYRDIEVLVSDNASSDGTAAIVDEMAASDSRVRLFRQPAPLPVSDNFNGLLDRAGGEYFMWAAHDDWWHPDFVARLVRLLDADPAAAMAFSGFANVSSDDVSDHVRTFAAPDAYGAADPVVRLGGYIMAEEFSGKANLIYGLFRRDRLSAAGGLLPRGIGSWGSDMLSVFRVLVDGPVACDDEILFHKRLSAAERQAAARTDSPIAIRELPHWQGYMLGYLRIIASSGTLDTRVRRALAAAVLQRMLSTGIASLRRLPSRAAAIR